MQCEITKSHWIGIFTDNGYAATGFLKSGDVAVGNYMYETECGTFVAAKIYGENGVDAMFLMEADKVRITPV